MIGRANRFHGYNALRHVYGRGQTVRGPHISLKYLPNTRRTSYRAAVVVSRKVHKSAVVRNRIRRRIYEIVRGKADTFNQPYDLVITVFSDQLAEMPAAELLQHIEPQFERAHIISTTKDTVSDAPGNAITATDDIVNAKESQ